MGQEIAQSHFSRSDFVRFERRLVSEMALLHESFRTNRFAERPPVIGLELEAWLVDATGAPQPRNAEFLRSMDSPLVVAELARHTIEFNVEPQPLTGIALRLMQKDLSETWQAAQRVAGEHELQVAAIGILPTLQLEHLTLESMSDSQRYRALNEQVLRLRRGRPLQIRIDGQEKFRLEHHDVMLESAATSLQIHFQVPLSQSVRYYNAAVIASAVMNAIAANSPLLFGKLLWAETRVPLFEQSVEIGGLFPRVHFGTGYALESLEEFFLENRSCHPVLLPMEQQEPIEYLPHVRLHNGTIWRWNRPLIGFEESGQPHLRVEHRVMPAGPTLVDMFANVALAAGLVHALSQQDPPPETQIPFEVAAANFQMACRDGLQAQLVWTDGQRVPVRELILDDILGLADQGLAALEIDAADRNHYLQIIARRAETGQNGADWQQKFVRRHGRDTSALTRQYLANQKAGAPVHEWTV
ncbi:glutamate--cysteine ligase [Planctomicrobium sp. SH664]|uniref:glutamate--cysteine ligase n=1 Tax=Planctomicrobium sp. SH664 TaxID=3448125 RepID=UPI003F5BD448